MIPSSHSPLGIRRTGPSHWRRASGARPGFSLIELMMVVLVMAVIAMATVPALGPSLQRARLKAAASEVVNALEFARLKAMTTGQETRVVVSSTNETIYVHRYAPAADLFNGGNALAAADVERPVWAYFPHPLVRGADYVIDLSATTRFRGTDVAASTIDTLNPVSFDPLGTPSHAGLVQLILGKQQLAVKLDAATGHVMVSE